MIYLAKRFYRGTVTSVQKGSAREVLEWIQHHLTTDEVDAFRDIGYSVTAEDRRRGFERRRA